MEVSINGDPQNGCFVTENPMKMDDLEVPLFQETSIYLFLPFFWGGLPSGKLT